MKKDFTNYSGYPDKTIVRCLKSWLKNHNTFHCPFQDIISCETHGDYLCRQVFPRLDNYGCPCLRYTTKYVIRIAKQAIKALE